MIIAVDLDGMLLAFPDFFSGFFKTMQSNSNAVGILTGRPESEKEEILKALAGIDIKPDFYIGMPDEMKKQDFPPGIYKATVCNDLKVDLLFDDFQTNDPKMLADFFSMNQTTVPFTSWAYKTD